MTGSEELAWERPIILALRVVVLGPLLVGGLRRVTAT